MLEEISIQPLYNKQQINLRFILTCSTIFISYLPSGYVAEMREKGRSNLLPFTEKLPPIDVPNFRQWNCQRCLHNCETENTSQETAFPSACNPSTVKPSAKNSQQDRNRVKIRPFGEGPSGNLRINNYGLFVF